MEEYTIGEPSFTVDATFGNLICPVLHQWYITQDSTPYLNREPIQASVPEKKTKFIDESGFVSRFRSKRTRESYLKNLRYYFLNFINMEPQDYLATNPDIEADITRWVQTQEKQNISPNTITNRVATLRSYLIECDIDIPKRFWRRLGLNSQPVSRDKVPTREELQILFNHFGLRERAFFGLLLSTGFRLSDALALKINQIDFTTTPPTIRYTSQKVRKQFVTFLTPEATTSIKEWLRVRPQWIARNSENFGKSNPRDEERLFPMSESAVNNALWVALNKSGLNQRDPITGKYLIHSHSFRKYTRTELAKVTTTDIGEYLLGHTEGLRSVYLRLDNAEQFLSTEWSKAKLSVFS